MTAHILVVDDSASMRQMVAFTLTGAGFTVTEAEDGVVALGKAKGAKFNAVVTDVNMPNMDGITLIKHLRELPGFYQAKRDLFNAALADSRFRIRPSAGTYFQLADYSAISDLPDREFVRWLTTEVGVAAIPVSVFYEQPPDARYVRFCFCKNDDTLRAAAAKLRAL
jgi:CheY-like chemotaxis protein